jgi:hypothetical protein
MATRAFPVRSAFSTMERSFRARGSVNIAGTADTVVSGYGSTLLAPGVGSALNAGLLEIRVGRRNSEGCLANKARIGCNVAGRFYASASTRLWATRTSKVPREGTTTGDSLIHVLETTQVPICGLGAVLSYIFFDDTVGTDKDARLVSMVHDLGFTAILPGPIQTPSSCAPLSFIRRRRPLADSKSDWAFDTTRSARGSRITAMGGNIDSFSHGQIIATIGLEATLNSGPLR